MVDHVEDVKGRSGSYWDERALAGSAHFAFPLWRRYCDQLHSRWLLSWLEGRTFAKVLKTDLFDEALGLAWLMSWRTSSCRAASAMAWIFHRCWWPRRCIVIPL